LVVLTFWLSLITLTRESPFTLYVDVSSVDAAGVLEVSVMYTRVPLGNAEAEAVVLPA
jgi:hypothetical protein